jgi:hypothetical protein
MAVALKVLVSMMSGARREIGVVDPAHDVGLRQRQEVVVALEVVRVVVKPAAEVGLRQPALLDLRAHGAVHHEDALAHEARSGGVCGRAA